MFFRKRDNATIILPPQPVSLVPSGEFDGNDGKWSTFYINVGGDGEGRGQNFKVLISTSSPLTLVPQQAEWCDQTCAENRGVGIFDSKQPLGFESESSVGWKDSGIFTIPLPDWWSGNKNLSGTWGTTAVGLGEASKESKTLADQFAVEYTFNDFFMGSFGLAAGAINPGSGAKSPFITNFEAFNQIPSISYGYTAGAYYRK